VTPSQLALAWVLHRGDDIVPIPGTKRRRYLEENVAATEIELTDEETEQIASALPEPSGGRYTEEMMRSVGR
jgi:aryl-alcohol dehydrogenase-like predicted oxidoreductase